MIINRLQAPTTPVGVGNGNPGIVPPWITNPENPGIVPPWLDPNTPEEPTVGNGNKYVATVFEPTPLVPEDPDTPHIM